MLLFGLSSDGTEKMPWLKPFIFGKVLYIGMVFVPVKTYCEVSG